MNSLDGKALNIDDSIVSNYLNSDEAGKRLKVAKLFGLVNLLMEQLDSHAKEIQRLKTLIEVKGEDSCEQQSIH
jgi:hypothetical protein